MSLFLGFRFHPTDDELVMILTNYLKKKITDRQIQVISEIDLYEYAPWELPELSYLKSKDQEWFFFCRLNMKYANGSRVNRTAKLGFWKVTGKITPIKHSSQTLGTRKTLIFYEGKPPGTRTDWVIHEYQLEDKELPVASNYQNVFVLCKIFKKSGKGPKNGEQHVAPFEEEADNEIFLFNGNKKYSVRLVLADDEINDGDERNGALVPFSPTNLSSLSRLEEGQNAGMFSSAIDSGSGQGAVSDPPQHSGTPIVVDCCPSYPQHYPSCPRHDIHKPVYIVSDEDRDTLTSNGSGVHQKLDSIVPNKSTVQDVDSREIFGDLEDISKLNSIHKPSFANHLEDEAMEDAEDFFEWNDTLSQLEPDVSDCKTIDCPRDPNCASEESESRRRIPASINNCEFNAHHGELMPHEEEFGIHSRIPASINNQELNALLEEVDSSIPCSPIYENVPSQEFSICGPPVTATTGEDIPSMIIEAHMSRVVDSNRDYCLTPEEYTVIKIFCNEYEYDKNQAELAQWCTDIRPKTLRDLLHGSWMDTTVMDAWFQTLMIKAPNCHVFFSALASWVNLPNGLEFCDSAFESLRERWGDHFSECRTLIFPIWSEDHFFLLVGNIEERRWDYYNSMMHRENDWKFLQEFVGFVNFQLNKLGWNGPYFWSINPVHGLPQQENSVDCGVFVIAYAEHAATGRPICFTQPDMWYYRARIVLDIYENQWLAYLLRNIG